MESLVTTPVESSVNGAADLQSVRSESIQGLSVVTALFRDGADIHQARQGLAERLSGLKLPEGVRAPALEPLTSSTMDLLKIGLVSEKLSPRELRAFVDWTLRPRLLAVPGVARATVFGGEVEQLQVQVRPEQLAAFDLTLSEVLEAAKAASAVRGAGFIETPAQRIVIQRGRDKCSRRSSSARSSCAPVRRRAAARRGAGGTRRRAEFRRRSHHG